MKYLSQAKYVLWPRFPRSNSLPLPSQDTSSQADIEKWKGGYSLACDMAGLFMQIKRIEHEQAARLEILLPHKDRCSALIARNSALLNHFKNVLDYKPTDEDAQWNVETLELWGEDLQVNLEGIDEAIDARMEEAKVLQNKLDQLMQETVDLAEIKEVAPYTVEQITEDSVMTDHMLSLSIIRRMENDCAQMKVAQTSKSNSDSFDFNRSYTSQQIDEMQRDEMVGKLFELKKKQHDLEKEDADKHRTEIEALARQIYDLGDELCLRGLACKDGSMVYDQVINGGSCASKTFSELFPDRAQAAKQNDDAGSVEVVEHLYQGPRLFDNISDSSIEKPKTRCEEEDERWIVGEELAEIKQKIRERVNRWQCNVEDTAVPSESGSNNSRAPRKDGLGLLISVVLGETLEPENEVSREAVGVIDRCMIDAWNRRTDRSFTELPEEAQSAHPRNVASHI